MTWIRILTVTTVLLGSFSRIFATPPQIATQFQAATSQPSETENGAQPSANGGFSGLSRSSFLLGDLWGVRPAIAKYGFDFTLAETSEVLGNVTGGAHTGAAYDGLTVADLQLDTQRAFAFDGGTFNVSALQIHGRNLSADNLYTLQTSSGIEADRATRLWELWYQQRFDDEDRFDVKIGQQSLDQEFMVSSNALVFVNTMFGWPMVPSADLPGGGPAYPLSAPGVRLKFRPTDSVTVLAGVFNGSPVSDNSGDPQKQNPSGTTFPLNGGALMIAEVQYAYPSLGQMVYADEPQLSGTYRLGAWYDTESFSDQRFDNSGQSQASLTTSGIPASHHGDYGIYGVMDQMVWYSDDDPDRNVSIFGRAMGTPQDDRNLIDFSLNAGFVMHEPILLRDDDTFGVGMGLARVSGSDTNLDRDAIAATGVRTPVRGVETFIEVTYQYQLTPWCQVQPDFQYIFNPGGGVSNPNDPSERIKNEAVLGVRFNLLF